NKEFKIKKDSFPAQSYIIRLDQPYSRCADMLLDTQYFNPDDPRPYDDTGWTLGPLYNVPTVRVVDKEVLDVPMSLLTRDVKIAGAVVKAKKTIAYCVNNRAETALTKFRYDLEDIRMLAAESGFKIGDTNFNAGTFIIPVENNPEDLADRLVAAVQELGLTATATAKMPDVKTHAVSVPRIAILHTWVFTQNEGWFRIGLEKSGIPYSYISVLDVRNTEDLKSKYDVIIFPPVAFGRAQRLVNGIGGDEPIPWKKMDKYPNLGGPDSSDDIRGGIELEGILHLKKFIDDGGLFIPITSNAGLPIDYGFVESVAVIKPQNLKMSGSVLQARISDPRSPVTYGYDPSLGVYFSGTPVLETGMKAATGGVDISDMFGGGGKGRPSGRGSLKDPDVIQGRPNTPTKVKGAGTGIPQEFQDMIKLFLPPDLQTVRVLVRFERKEKLLISGMLDGGEALQNKAAVVDVPMGKGHILFFAINPMWRHQTLGSYPLLFNAALHYDHLDAGRPAKKAEETEKEDQSN
ncbi:MAG: hypothetical protein JXB23_13905, partial [Candidatus Aminicenantes bacterium]|nr:hypothetical protein [Candidatus Aminicenantes bacterium]